MMEKNPKINLTEEQEAYFKRVRSYMEKATIEISELNLINLNGSEKQVKWANDIRVVFCNDVFHAVFALKEIDKIFPLDSNIEEIKTFFSSLYNGKYDCECAEECKKNLESFSLFITRVEGILQNAIEAKYYIEYIRNIPFRFGLSKRVLEELYESSTPEKINDFFNTISLTVFSFNDWFEKYPCNKKMVHI